MWTIRTLPVRKGIKQRTVQDFSLEKKLRFSGRSAKSTKESSSLLTVSSYNEISFVAFVMSLDTAYFLCAFCHFSPKHTVFTALHGMQTRSSDENSVCLSVRLSNA